MIKTIRWQATSQNIVDDTEYGFAANEMIRPITRIRILRSVRGTLMSSRTSFGQFGIVVLSSNVTRLSGDIP